MEASAAVGDKQLYPAQALKAVLDESCDRKACRRRNWQGDGLSEDELKKSNGGHERRPPCTGSSVSPSFGHPTKNWVMIGVTGTKGEDHYHPHDPGFHFAGRRKEK